MDTVFALASGQGRAGVAVIRVSGPQALACFEKLTGIKNPQPRHALVSTLKDPASGTKIDHALAIFFANPSSFTGEDVAEFHTHGGRAVIEALLAALAKMEGCRIAEPGEFTKRAFTNGKMDLTAAEAVADLIAAETEAQRLQALTQLEGGLEKLYRGWADWLSHLLAHQEADIEFPDEDMPKGISDSLKEDISKILKEIEDHLDDGRRGERLRDGVLVAILGAPNAGKSSLLNALARRPAAIVSSEAGTTRDVIEVHLDLGGYPVTVADTAGLREAAGAIEAEGIRRAKDIASRADLKIALFDATQKEDAETKNLVDDRTITVYSKCDLAKPPAAAIGLSAFTGAGLEAFIKTLAEKVAAEFKAKSGPPLTRERHRQALTEAADALRRSQKAELPELAAEDLRLSLRALGRITGRVHVEELLDRIFRDFCIGK